MLLQLRSSSSNSIVLWTTNQIINHHLPQILYDCVGNVHVSEKIAGRLRSSSPLLRFQIATPKCRWTGPFSGGIGTKGHQRTWALAIRPRPAKRLPLQIAWTSNMEPASRASLAHAPAFPMYKAQPTGNHCVLQPEGVANQWGGFAVGIPSSQIQWGADIHFQSPG